MSMVPFASLLTFPADWRADVRQRDGRAAVSAAAKSNNGPAEGSGRGMAGKAHTSTPPPDTHLLVTTSYPAPATFAPLHYARHALRSGHCVIWLGCAGGGEAHVLRAVRGALGSRLSDGGNSARRLLYLDALDSLFKDPVAGSSSGSDDARPALLRLQHRLSQAIVQIRRSSAGREGRGDSDEADEDEEQARQSEISAETLGDDASPVTVIIEDASTLAWSIMNLSSLAQQQEEGKSSSRNDAETKSTSEDPRIELLRDKRKQGLDAIHRDDIGHRLGAYIEILRAECCRPSGAVLITHLSADNTSISTPSGRSPATRGGSYGVGTGFDADDAGEENEEDELYEDVEDDLWQAKRGAPGKEEDGTEDQQVGGSSEKGKQTVQSRFGGGVAASSVDWRVDSLLRNLLLGADVWIEIRGLRSGRARDCHGELCTYALARPCLARGDPLPHLPMPADPLAALRAHDRTATPLKTLSRLSLRAQLAPSSSSVATNLGQPGARPPTSVQALSVPLAAFALLSWCEGRDAAMLFRVEPSGEAVAWSRGSTREAAVAER